MYSLVEKLYKLIHTHQRDPSTNKHIREKEVGGGGGGGGGCWERVPCLLKTGGNRSAVKQVLNELESFDVLTLYFTFLLEKSLHQTQQSDNGVCISHRCCSSESGFERFMRAK